MNRAASARSALGITLVELLVGLLIFSLLAAGAFAAISSQQRTAALQQHAESAIDGARSLLEIIGAQVRAAKGGMPSGRVLVNHRGRAATTLLDSPPGVAGANCRSMTAGEFELPTIQVVDGGANGPDVLRVLYPDGAAWGRVESAVGHATASLLFRTREGNSAAPALAEDDWVLVTDFSTNAILFQDQSANLQAGTACAGAATDWCFTTPATAAADAAYPGTLPAGAFLIKAHWVEYRIAGDQLLVRDLLSGREEPAVEAADDLQVALGYDWRDAGGAVSPTGDGWLNEDGCCGGAGSDEWIWNSTLDAFPVAGSPSACDLGRLRAVRVTLVVRAPSQMPGAVSSRPAAEDRSAGTADGFYRVALQSTLALR